MSKLFTDASITNEATPADTDRFMVFDPTTGKISYITKLQLETAIASGSISGTVGTTNEQIPVADGTGGSTLKAGKVFISDLVEVSSDLLLFHTGTSDGADNLGIAILGGGEALGSGRGGYIYVTGNESTNLGKTTIASGESEGIDLVTPSDQAVDITAGRLDMGGSEALRLATGTISSAQILNSNSSPVELIAAPGAGQAIAVHKIVLSMDYNSATYATNTDGELRFSGGTVISSTAILESTADDIFIATPNAIEINESIQFNTFSGNPTTGNSDIKYKIWYTIETI